MNVLLMAYGTPYTPEEIEPYYTDIRRGRRPSEELVRELEERYHAIGKSPLNEITLVQAIRLQALLNLEAPAYPKRLLGPFGPRIPQGRPGSTWAPSTGIPPSGRPSPPCTRMG